MEDKKTSPTDSATLQDHDAVKDRQGAENSPPPAVPQHATADPLAVPNHPPAKNGKAEPRPAKGTGVTATNKDPNSEDEGSEYARVPTEKNKIGDMNRTFIEGMLPKGPCNLCINGGPNEEATQRRDAFRGRSLCPTWSETEKKEGEKGKVKERNEGKEIENGKQRGMGKEMVVRLWFIALLAIGGTVGMLHPPSSCEYA
jgi:hypothetical protein